MLANSNVAPETDVSHYRFLSLRYNLKPLYIERTNGNVGCGELDSVFFFCVCVCLVVKNRQTLALANCANSEIKLTYDAPTIM